MPPIVSDDNIMSNSYKKPCSIYLPYIGDPFAFFEEVSVDGGVVEAEFDGADVFLGAAVADVFDLDGDLPLRLKSRDGVELGLQV